MIYTNVTERTGRVETANGVVWLGPVRRIAREEVRDLGICGLVHGAQPLVKAIVRCLFQLPNQVLSGLRVRGASALVPRASVASLWLLWSAD